ncbi:MAG: C40 family peptidase [Gracilimonas sp.]|nr:C40 family peptidase [Gracilimonas sp.]
MTIKKASLIVFTAVILAACGTVKRGTIPWEEETTSTTPVNSPEDTPPKSSSVNEENTPPEIKERQEFLELAYQDWKGVPYRLGGAGYEGIDCSAFMQVVFEDYFFEIIPRTTLEQLEHGKAIKKRELKTGDMVFFKTGRKSYHVGVMINQDDFLHASTSFGVIISSLEEDYWQKTYLAARRVL